MVRQLRLILIAAIIIGAARESFAQSKPRPEFEAAAIRLNKSCAAGGRGGGGMTSPGRITLECAQLRDLILTACEIYGGRSSPESFRMQVLGGPAWIDTDRYDLAVKAEGNPSLAQMYGPILKALLEDRFRLKVHRETREASVYLLTVAKDGPRLQATSERGCLSVHPAPEETQLPTCGSINRGSNGKLEMFGATMADLSTQLGIRLDRDVIDQTGLAGNFDIHLEVSRTDLVPRFLAGGSVLQANSQTVPDLTGPSIFSALEQQLGLKLKPAKGPVTVLVIDNIERPSAN